MPQPTSLISATVNVYQPQKFFFNFLAFCVPKSAKKAIGAKSMRLTEISLVSLGGINFETCTRTSPVSFTLR